MSDLCPQGYLQEIESIYTEKYHPDNYKGDFSFNREDIEVVLYYKGIRFNSTYCIGDDKYRPVLYIRNNKDAIHSFAFEHKFKAKDLIDDLMSCYKHHESLKTAVSISWFHAHFATLEVIDFLDKKDIFFCGDKCYLSIDNYRNKVGFDISSIIQWKRCNTELVVLQYNEKYHPRNYKGGFSFKRTKDSLQLYYKDLLCYSNFWLYWTCGYDSIFNINVEMDFKQFAFENKFKIQDITDDYLSLWKHYHSLSDFDLSTLIILHDKFLRGF